MVIQSTCTRYVFSVDIGERSSRRLKADSKIPGPTIVPILRNITGRLDVVLRKSLNCKRATIADRCAVNVPGEERWTGPAGLETSLGSLNDC